jgi:uncharacterized protein
MSEQTDLSALRLKEEALVALLARTEGVVVAFSGGVDSTYLLSVAREALGKKVLAVTAASPAFPEAEAAQARELCALLGVEHVVVQSNELEVEGYRDNPPNRCYLCKSALFRELWEVARARGFSTLVDGSNKSDEGDYRPGLAALGELGVRSPLREAGLYKDEIRLLSRERGLPTWNKPSFACLASRIPYGEAVTPQKLQMAGAAEAFLHGRGFEQVRVRVHGKTARVEVLPGDLDRLLARPLRDEVNDALLGLGFSHVSVDLAGYRTGSMNADLL